MSKRGLTDEELLEILMRDDNSDIDVLSEDDEAKFGWIDDDEGSDNDIQECEAVQNENDNSDRIEIIIDNDSELEDNEPAHSSPRTQSPNNVHPPVSPLSNEFFKQFHPTKKIDVKWKNNVSFETKPVEWSYTANSEDADLPAPIVFSKNTLQKMS